MSDLNKDMEWIFKREDAVLKEAEKYLASGEFSSEFLLQYCRKLVNEYKKLLRQNMKLVTFGDVEQKYLFQIQSELKSILDNTGQGIFTTDENLLIDSKYSTECARIFGQSLENKKFSDILRVYNSEETITLIEQVLCPQIFYENENRRRVMIMLLPDEIYFEGKTILMVCKVISDESKEPGKNRFLFLLTDISEKKQLENQMLEKQKLINTIIKIVSDNNLFKNCGRAFRDFLSLPENRIFESSGVAEEELREAFRKLHTFRGDFSIFELDDLVFALHRSEQNLAELLKADKLPSREMVMQAFDRDNLKAIFERSIERLRNIIGNGFFEFEKEEVTIERKTLKMLTDKISVMKEGFDSGLDVTIRRLYQVDLKELLKSYPEYTLRLAQRNGKSVKAFSINASSCLFVDENRFSPFTRTLVHVFRNAVVHGIEDPAVRLEEGKEEMGRIECRIWEESGAIHMEISDDGRGIDIEKVEKKALDLRLCQTIDINDSQTLLDVLSSDGFSTVDEPDQYSGRGEGLADLRHELKLLGGKAYLKTCRGKGSVFRFIIPKVQI